MKRSLKFAFVAISALATGWLVSTSRAATETPDYSLVKKDGKVEIRDYPELTVATVPMEEGMNDSFMKLFRFISGSNAGSQKIEMTTPVLVDGASSKRTMSFIVPKSTVAAGIPRPTGEGVSIRKIESARFVALRFSGKRAKATEEKAVARLRDWLSAGKIAAKGEPVFAYYDPPWMPVFLRRNEVMFRIERAKE